jgi:uncharacterized protein (DUF1501 family)
MKNRREFLKVGCCRIGTLSAASAFGRLGMMNAMAQSAPDYKALVCVFLFGGNDGNNLIVPADAGYQPYATARAGLALPQANLLQIAPASGGLYGLHPRMAGVRTLFQQGKAAVVANVGMLVRPTTPTQYQQRTAAVPANLFSHSDQQQQWQNAAPNGNASTGWAGRVADAVAPYNSPSTFPTGVSMAGSSLFLAGQMSQPGTIVPGSNMALDGSDGTPQALARDAAFNQLLSFDSGLALVQRANFLTGEGLRVGKLINDALKTGTPLTTVFPTSSLGQQLAQVARVIKVRNELGMKRQIFFCSAGGYDTHSNQIVEQDNLFNTLDPALKAFYDATVEMGIADSVTTFTESEFGRTLQPSSGAGTDHAWGSHHIVIGGKVKGGDLYGKFPTLALGGPDDTGNRGSFIPTTSLDQYGATLASWFGVADSGLPAVFPNLVNFPTQKLAFL